MGEVTAGRCVKSSFNHVQVRCFNSG